jgi:hypothetical protein
MKKAIYAIMCVILLAIVFSCNGDEETEVLTYTGKDMDGVIYTLIVTDGSTYELTIEADGEKFSSTGKVSKQGDTWVCTPNAAGAAFVVTVSGDKITKITGSIPPDTGEDPITPSEIDDGIRGEPVKAYGFDWYAIDDAKLNSFLDVQTIFPPGGASKITNSIRSTPFVHPAGTVTDIDGNVINETVFNFTGVTKVIKPNRTAKEGAQFPLTGWEATPDAETLAKLKTAKSYSFWIRLNSATLNNWSFLTAVVTDFALDKGYEFKHWFGNRAGDSGGVVSGKPKINNFTGSLVVGTWYKITVVMDNTSGSFNMEQDKWIHTYPPSPKPPNVFSQDKAKMIQWQIPLQHNGGTARGGDPYDIIDGEYNFDCDFYGLEFNME